MEARQPIGLSLIIVLLIFFTPFSLNGQSIDHWEAIILAENTWNYFVGNSEPPSNWYQHGFNDNAWPTGPGGIGYGDDDDATVIESAYSVYLRKEFNIVNTSSIAALYLHADYDDAFVAYLNGVEICRSNIGTVGIRPTYDESTYEQREAKLYRGGIPDVFLVDRSLLNNGNNTLAIQVHNNSSQSSDLSSLIFLTAGITDDSNNYQTLPSWFENPVASSNLPILSINTGGQNIISEPKIAANLGIIDNGSGNLNYITDPHNGYDGKIGIEIRGSSSQDFPKKSYGFETRLEDGSNNNVSLLGLPPENDWVLYAPYSDKSLMRNVLAMHIGAQTGDYTPRTKWCELYINNEYLGVYVLMEKIKRDSNRVDIAKLKSSDTEGIELTGGYIFSVEREEVGKGWKSPYNNKPFYRFRYPAYDDIGPEQKNYLINHITQFENLVDNASSLAEYKDYIHLPSFVNYWIANEIFKHIDNYKFSFYMYKTKDDEDGDIGKIHFGPLWDLNLAFGNYDFTQDCGPTGWSYIWADLPYLRPSWIYDISEEPEIQNKIACQWKTLRQNNLSTSNLLAFIDAQAALLEDAQKRNFTKWPILGTYVYPNKYVGQTYAEEINYLKSWLNSRLTWLDDNMLGTCDLSTISDDDPDNLPSKYKLYQNYPNPFNPNTTITYDISGASDVSINIYDVTGNLITNIFTGYQEAGSYSVNFSSNRLPTGVYFYRINTNDWVDTKKMVYIK